MVYVRRTSNRIAADKDPATKDSEEAEAEPARPPSRTRLSTPPVQTAASTRASKRHSGASSAPSEAVSEPDPENDFSVVGDSAVSPVPSVDSSTSAEPEANACRVFSLGERVFAKMKGYPHWPALITEVPAGSKKTPGRRRYTLLFYGTKESASLDGKDLCLYEENKELFGKPNPIAGFNAAIREVEEEISHKDDDEETPRLGVRASRRRAAAAFAAREASPAFDLNASTPFAADLSPTLSEGASAVGAGARKKVKEAEPEAAVSAPPIKAAATPAAAKTPTAKTTKPVGRPAKGKRPAAKEEADEEESDRKRLKTDFPDEEEEKECAEEMILEEASKEAEEEMTPTARRPTRRRSGKMAPSTPTFNSAVDIKARTPVNAEQEEEEEEVAPEKKAEERKRKQNDDKVESESSNAEIARSTPTPVEKSERRKPAMRSAAAAATAALLTATADSGKESEAESSAYATSEPSSASGAPTSTPRSVSNRRKTQSAEAEVTVAKAETTTAAAEEVEAAVKEAAVEKRKPLLLGQSEEKERTPIVPVNIGSLEEMEVEKAEDPSVPAPVIHLGDNDILRGAYNYDPLPKEYQDAFRLPTLFSQIATPDIPREGPWAHVRVVEGIEYQPYELSPGDRRQLREKALLKYKEVRKEAWNAFVVPGPKNLRSLPKDGEAVIEEKSKETKKTSAVKKSLAPEELEKKKGEAKLRKIKEKIELMRREKQLMLIDLEVKKSLRRGSEDVKRAAVVLDYLMDQSVSALMLIRCPQIVHTIRKVKCYKKDMAVCAKANTIYMRFRQLFFLTSQSKNFDAVFDRECERFKAMGKKTHIDEMEKLEEKREEKLKRKKEDGGRNSREEGKKGGASSNDLVQSEEEPQNSAAATPRSESLAAEEASSATFKSSARTSTAQQASSRPKKSSKSAAANERDDEARKSGRSSPAPGRMSPDAGGGSPAPGRSSPAPGRRSPDAGGGSPLADSGKKSSSRSPNDENESAFPSEDSIKTRTTTSSRKSRSGDSVEEKGEKTKRKRRGDRNSETTIESLAKEERVENNIKEKVSGNEEREKEKGRETVVAEAKPSDVEMEEKSETEAEEKSEERGKAGEMKDDSGEIEAEAKGKEKEEAGTVEERESGEKEGVESSIDGKGKIELDDASEDSAVEEPVRMGDTSADVSAEVSADACTADACTADACTADTSVDASTVDISADASRMDVSSANISIEVSSVDLSASSAASAPSNAVCSDGDEEKKIHLDSKLPSEPQSRVSECGREEEREEEKKSRQTAEIGKGDVDLQENPKERSADDEGEKNKTKENVENEGLANESSNAGSGRSEKAVEEAAEEKSKSERESEAERTKKIGKMESEHRVEEKDDRVDESQVSDHSSVGADEPAKDENDEVAALAKEDGEPAADEGEKGDEGKVEENADVIVKGDNDEDRDYENKTEREGQSPGKTKEDDEGGASTDDTVASHQNVDA